MSAKENNVDTINGSYAIIAFFLFLPIVGDGARGGGEGGRPFGAPLSFLGETGPFMMGDRTSDVRGLP